MANPSMVPSFADVQNYKVNRPGQNEAIRQSLYDFQTYAAAGQTQLIFFQVPKGQSSKTIADTNMEIAGSLPAPKFFLVQAIELHFYPGNAPVALSSSATAITSNINDAYAVHKSGSLNFFVGSKTYLEEAPVGRFPQSTRLDVFGNISDQTSAASALSVSQSRVDYAVMAGRPYIMQPPVLLEPNQNFAVTLNWPAAVALPSGVAGRIGICLQGVLYRLSQ